MPINLDLLFQTVENVTELIIVPHNNPDPDALAAAVSLQYLLTQSTSIGCRVAYSGIIGRAENKALARYLNISTISNTIQPRHPSHPVALIDTQPGVGNIALPPDTRMLLVIDDHTLRLETTAIPYVDVRPSYGATSTILVEYFQAAEIQLPQTLATALFYGIKTNTMGLSRNAGSQDIAAYYWLQPQIDFDALAKIEQARVPAQYFKSFDAALRNAQFYGDLVFANLEEIDYPDLSAELADMLMRLERANWVVCVGAYQQTLMISVRSRYRKYDAAKLVETLVQNLGTAGGHGTIAGGQIPLAGQNINTVIEALIVRIHKALNIPLDVPGQPLF